MTLAVELSSTYEGFVANAPADVVSAVQKATSDFSATYDPSTAIKVGAVLPPFTLPDALGNTVSSIELLKKGPLLITFYRGSWCPYCNLALHSLQKIITAVHESGVTLVAITPQLPDGTLTTTEKENLTFPVLSDVGCTYATELGIVFHQPASLRPAFEQFGHDFVKYNGDDSLKVPIPATLLVDEEGVVRNLFLDTDYKKRLEPATALEWIKELKAETKVTAA